MEELPADSTASSNSSGSVVETNSNNSAAVDPPPDPSHNAAASSTGYNDGATLGVSAAGGASGGINVPHSMSIMSPVGSSPVPQAATVASEPPVRATDGTTSSDSSLVPAVPPLSGSLAEVAGALPPSSTNSAPAVLDGLGPRQAAAPAANGAELNDSHHSVFDAGQAEGGRGSLQTSVQRSASLEGVGGSEAEGRTAMVQRSRSTVGVAGNPAVGRDAMISETLADYCFWAKDNIRSGGDGTKAMMRDKAEIYLDVALEDGVVREEASPDEPFANGACITFYLLAVQVVSLIRAIGPYLKGPHFVIDKGTAQQREVYVCFKDMDTAALFLDVDQYSRDARFRSLSLMGFVAERVRIGDLYNPYRDKFAVMRNLPPTNDRAVVLALIRPYGGVRVRRVHADWSLEFGTTDEADKFAEIWNGLKIAGSIIAMEDRPSL